MLLKVLFILLLLYIASRAVGNLLRAVLHDPKASERIDSSRNGVSRRPTAPSKTGRYETQVEDARWVDLKGEDR